MNDHTKCDRFAMFLMTISETYDFEFSQAAMTIWSKALAPYDISDIERALAAHISDTDRGEFKPKPASIIRHIEGTTRNRSETAAAILISATSMATARQSVSFADQMINAAVAQTRGWVSAYYCLVNPLTADDYLSEFKSAYERLTISANPHPAYLPGRDGADSYVVIGDEAAVDLVVSTGYNPKKPLLAAYSSVKQITN